MNVGFGIGSSFGSILCIGIFLCIGIGSSESIDRFFLCRIIIIIIIIIYENVGMNFMNMNTRFSI